MQIVKRKENVNIDKGYNPLCQTYKQLSFKNYFQKVDQHTEGKYLIHGTKHHKDNQLQSPKPTSRIS